MAERTFDAEWLALREPVDHRSRATALLPLLAAEWRARGWSRVLDLGSGTGSNLRYLAPRLPGTQEWTLVDHDAGLLARVEPPHLESTARLVVRRERGDLAREGLARVDAAHLVTASALLDLVSEAWLAQLVDACAAAGCAVLMALTWDGGMTWSGAAEAEDPGDALVREAVTAHQRRAKGLGPALGPAAAERTEGLLAGAGYRTWLLPSPWHLGPADAALVHALVDGWEEAAAEERPERAEVVHGWAERRRRMVSPGSFALTVGHLDLLGFPRVTAGP